MQVEKISERQAVLITANFVLASAVLLIPGATLAEARQDGWISMILATAAGLAIAANYSYLGARFPEETIVQYSPRVIGKVLGKAYGLALVWFALQLGALVSRNFGDVFVTVFMPETPLIVFNLSIILIAAWAVRSGIEVIARVNDFIIPVVLGSITLLFLLVFASHGEVRYTNLLPVFERGLVPVLRGAYPAIGFPYGETIVMAMILPFLNDPREGRWAFPLGLSLGGLFLLLITLLTILTLDGLAANQVYPVLVMARQVSVAGFLDRVEPLIIVAWALSGFLKVTTCLYAASLGLAQWLNLADYRPLVLPIAALQVFLSVLLYEDILQQIEFATKIWTVYALPIEFLIPLLIHLVATVRGPRARVAP